MSRTKTLVFERQGHEMRITIPWAMWLRLVDRFAFART